MSIENLVNFKISLLWAYFFHSSNVNGVGGSCDCKQGTDSTDFYISLEIARVYF